MGIPDVTKTKKPHLRMVAGQWECFGLSRYPKVCWWQWKPKAITAYGADPVEAWWCWKTLEQLA